MEYFFADFYASWSYVVSCDFCCVVLNTVTENKKDKFNRVIAECYVNSESLSSFMVRSGYAFDFKKYSKGKFKIEEINPKIFKSIMCT